MNILFQTHFFSEKEVWHIFQKALVIWPMIKFPVPRQILIARKYLSFWPLQQLRMTYWLKKKNYSHIVIHSFRRPRLYPHFFEKSDLIRVPQHEVLWSMKPCKKGLKQTGWSCPGKLKQAFKKFLKILWAIFVSSEAINLKHCVSVDRQADRSWMHPKQKFGSFP